MVRMIALFLVMLVLLTAHSPVQQATATQNPNPKTEIIRTRLSRPLEIGSLKGYVKRYLPGKYNPSTLLKSVTEEGYPRLTFSFFEHGLQKNSELVDFGSYLELTTTSTAAFGEPSTVEGEQTPQELSPEVDDSNKMTLAAVQKTCGGLTSTDNLYDCCANNSGNCTFAAWEMAKQYWNGHLLPRLHNGGQWYTNAQNANYPTSRTPALFSLAVSQTMAGGLGHVGLVKAINGSNIVLEDQQCGVNGLQERSYSLSNFYGYILNPAVNTQSMTAYGMSPQTLNAGTNDQQVLFSVSNIQGNLRAIVIFPSGYRGTLIPSGQIWVYGYQTVGTRIRLSERGQYSIQFFNTNGVYSPLYYFQVN